MKKTLVLTLLGLFLLGSQSFAQLSFGVKGGLNMANISVSGTGGSSPKSIIGYHIGPFGEFMFTKSLGVGAALLFSTKGAKQDMSYSYFDGTSIVTINGTSTRTLNYLEIPITAKYCLNLATAKIFFFAGPYFGYGLSGKDKTEITGQPTTTTTLKWGSSQTDDIKKMDVGLTVGAGAQISKFLVSINYNPGMTNWIPKPSGSEKYKNVVVGISIGYYIFKI